MLFADAAILSEAGDQLFEQRVEFFLFGPGQHRQHALLVRDMAADGVVDDTLAGIGERDELAA